MTRTSLVVLIIVTLLVLPSANAQPDDHIARARQLAASGNRAEAIRLLEMRVIERPDDLDARTLLGTVLSWDRQFDRARQELEMVAARDPKNLDARLALIRVELWSGNTVRARELARETAEAFPASAEAAALRAQTRQEPGWELQAGGRYESFEGSDDWKEGEVSLRKQTRLGPAVVRATHASRFGLDDDQFELEVYPRISRRSYVYASIATSTEHQLYPRTRAGVELFGGFGNGFEASAGYRWLDFEDSVNVYTASASKYYRDWLFTIRGYRTDEQGTSVFGTVRRYFGDGDEYVGLRVGRGSTRDEIRSTADVETLDARELMVETRVNLAPRLSLQVRGGVGNEERAGGDARHVTAGALLGVRF